ncbi:dTDP-4-dehydrorhamnose 3,5-epimerase [Sediminicurvatus halobius]|uniref:dTDP-4-dehydrorhamnose 3,5-epimerase n=1 Tax=Sediminicurvatus halobius TaxID=2182432 RepID=A0A2U2MXA7_9GAMM|nr:dTDP-4-dehydrorhamnose 3,5-epimerase [Spiribacter halobius]PWG61462.1 dTDP-4-dehydrorhamnose 3,5-epimerase [Spiribacter halobius]UEX77247.1 dTDP-4-dehydrorhamnose 3,5-epimerase [Spiribacter halobius]
MHHTPTHIPDVLLLTPKVHGDHRGFFMETWNARVFAELGLDLVFVQDNHSRSQQGTLRGLHYQIRQPQGKLVRVTVGEVFDVAVDMRRSSATFGQWVGERLSAENKRMLWVPPGFAHGFLVLSDAAEFQYKCTDYYAPEHERTLRWDDPDLGIEWPLTAGNRPLLSEKDASGAAFAEAEAYP